MIINNKITKSSIRYCTLPHRTAHYCTVLDRTILYCVLFYCDVFGLLIFLCCLCSATTYDHTTSITGLKPTASCRQSGEKKKKPEG